MKEGIVIYEESKDISKNVWDSEKTYYRTDIEYKIEYVEVDGYYKVDYGYYLGQDLFLIQFYITNHKRDKSYSKKAVHKISPNTSVEKLVIE